MKKTILLILMGLLLAACSLPLRLSRRIDPPIPDFDYPQGFASNGEQIYFTATNNRGEIISYQGGPDYGGMMMQPRLTCASCHAPDGRGGGHWMHMDYMEAPDIRWDALSHEEAEEHQEEHSQEGYTLEMFSKAVVDGQHPDGDPLDQDMPRWQMDDQDLEDLFGYLKTLP